ncbi:MAG TPA: cysteine--tRNA ligase [Gemmatimonadaceae bacterium]|jgi:cysteinyl-tRNA synthetase|nr:cysteine--tRNA ligase [Gemmatimonadaceae bacterium]
MTAFSLYNTLTRRVEPFAPAEGDVVRMYTCGPTVYNPAHLGNFRTFLFEDLLRRVLRLRGWNVQQVMNLTDVDDKIITRAAQRGVMISEITEPMTEVFQHDREYLRIEPAEIYPKATDHIPEMIALVEALVERGLAYQADDGSVYFAIARFPEYGKLSRLDQREIQPGARVAADDYNKEDVRDFALWKAAKPEDERVGAAWDSPWGRGRPGWHLECSAMARRYLGDTLDIHAGGVDLVFPHHEDEIAQSEGATGKPFARFWAHGEFLLTDGAKMAKRVGNVATVADLREQGISAAALRHFMFNTHYRKQLNLTPEALEASREAVRRVGDFAERLEGAMGGTPALAAAADELERDAKAALFTDLNAPGAIGALFTFIRRANAELDAGGTDVEALERAREVFDIVNGVLDIVPERALSGAVAAESLAQAAGERGGDALPAGLQEEAARIQHRLDERRAARARRDFAAADAIRDELAAEGVVIEDTPQGTRWKKVR